MGARHLLSFPLSEKNSSLFDEYEEPPFSVSQSVLKEVLSIQLSPIDYNFNVSLINACKLLWHVPWPEGEALSTFSTLFCKSILKFLVNNDVFVVFDRYFRCSIKSTTRQHRAGNFVPRYQLTLSTPLPARKRILSSVENKTALINILFEEVLCYFVKAPQQNMLLVSGVKLIPETVVNGIRGVKQEFKSSHEEADVTPVHFSQLAYTSRTRSI